MAGVQDPAIQRRRLRTELRRARTNAGYTQKEAAEAMDWSASKLIRIENGSVGITPVDLRALLALYGGVDKEQLDELVAMARSSRRAGWSAYRGILSREFLLYLDFEASAAIIRQVEPLLVPGLLQTEEYARALLRDAFRVPPENINRLWEVRQERQELFDREDPPQMFFVLDEAAVRRWVGGPGVARRQLEHLTSLVKEQKADIRTIPFSVGGHPGMRGPFTVLEFAEPSDDDVLYLENTRGDVYTRDDPELTSPYAEIFLDLQDLAVGGQEFIRMVDKILAEMPASGTGSS